MTSPNHSEPPVLRRQRLKVPIACQTCRSQKAKCDGGRPACARCRTHGRTCNYTKDPAVTLVERKRPRKLARKQISAPVLHTPPHSHEASSTPTAASAPVAIEPSNTHSGEISEDGTEQNDQDRACCTAHGRFTGQVTAAIDERTGVVPRTPTHPVPLVDAPLFGELELPLQTSTLLILEELPTRARADLLTEIYWTYIDPAEPILDESQFYEAVDAAYSAPSNLVRHRRIWLSIINLVCALAVQRQEFIPLGARNHEGTLYFRRAWALLPAESILWQPGSLELVQCLMLMNRYLHCTNNQQKTWMTAGLALRIAQNMCCHLDNGDSVQVDNDNTNKRLRQKVWASCVDLDRCVSWSLGRTSALMLISAPMVRFPQQGGHDSYLQPWVQELHEIGNQIQLAQVQTGVGLAERSAASRLGRQEEYHAAAIHLDGCLNRWESRLPVEWQLQNLKLVKDKTARMERYILHLRILHARIYLYRPMLAEFYSMRTGSSKSTRPPTQPANFSERLLKEYAAVCVEVAQKVTSIVMETMEATDLDGPGIGTLAWWNRLYYLHIAGVIFLAAMVGSELFTESVAQSWQAVLTAMRSHVHLSTYVQQCVCTFEALSARMLQQQRMVITMAPSAGQPLQGVGKIPPTEGDGGFCSSGDVFEDILFDFDDFLFGAEDGIDFGALC